MKQALLILYFAVGLLCLQECAQATHSDLKYACHGTAVNCSFVELTCRNNLTTGVILRAQYGYQPANSGCSTAETTNCTNVTCCEPVENACYNDFTENDFNSLYWKCWKQSCPGYQVPRNDSHCSNSSHRISSFVRLQHACLKDVYIIDVNQNHTISGAILAVRYNGSQSYNNGFWQCKVTTTTPSLDPVSITAVREPRVNMSENCSMIYINGNPCFNCNSNKVTYTVLHEWNGFTINLYRLPENDFPFGWVIMQAPNGTNLTARCGEYCGENIHQCTDINSTLSTMEYTAMDSSTTPYITSSTGSETTKFAFSTESATPTAKTDLTLTTAPTMDSTASAASPGSNAGAVAGGVVAALLVLVAAVVGVFCFVRRRRQKLQEAKAAVTGTSPERLPMKSLQSSSSSGHRPPQPGSSGKREDVTSDLPAKTRDYFLVEPESCVNGRVAEASELDYDRLGGKKPQSPSSNPAATYGRLGEVRGGGEDTDYSYDHLARGRQAGPDVIDSDYDTSALHVTSEGDYNVAGIPRKQHVITGSDYDVAQVVTSEGDYNRVDFQGKKQHVITGSDYDTAEIVTSEGDYNKVDFQGKKQKVVTGSDYDVATAVTSDNP